jgi:hypothetical protein
MVPPGRKGTGRYEECSGTNDDENILRELAGHEHPFYIIDLGQVFHQTFQVFKAMSLDKALDYLGLKFEGRCTLPRTWLACT